MTGDLPDAVVFDAEPLIAYFCDESGSDTCRSVTSSPVRGSLARVVPSSAEASSTSNRSATGLPFDGGAIVASLNDRFNTACKHFEPLLNPIFLEIVCGAS